MRRKLVLFLLLLAISQIVHALEVKQITFEQGKMLQPVLAPGNKMIAFLQEQNGKTSLYLKPFSVTGGTAQPARKIYETYGKPHHLQWVPTGSGVAFIESSRAGNPGTLTVVGLDGKVQKLLADVELFAFHVQGTKLVYKKSRDLHIQDLRTKSSKKIITETLFTVTSLAWRRDGVITFAKKPLWGYPQLCSVDENGREKLLLSLTGHSQITDHLWSDDNRTLAFCDKSSNLSSLWIQNEAGKRLMIASGDVDFAGWYGKEAHFFTKKDSQGRSQIWLATFASEPEPPKHRPIPAPAEEEIYYRNTFDREVNWGSYDKTRTGVKKGVLEIKVDKKNQELKFLAPVTIPQGNYSVQLELENLKKEGRAGLVFNFQDWNNFFVLEVEPQNRTYRLLQYKNNRRTSIIGDTKTSDLNAKGKNKLLLRKRGSQVEIYLNDRYQRQAAISFRETAAEAGIWIASGSKTPVEFAFDNFQINLPKGYRPPTTGGTIFFDDFSNSKSGWSAGNFREVSANYHNGTYRIRIYNRYSAYGFLAPTSINTDSYTVETELDLEIAKQGEAGLIFNFTDWNNFFLFQVNPVRRSYQVYRYRSGRRETLAEGRLDLYRSQNKLKVVVEKSALSFYCNERLLTKKSSSTPRNLQVGLTAGAGDRTPFEVSFDNFKVTGSGQHPGFQPLAVPNQRNWSLIFVFQPPDVNKELTQPAAPSPVAVATVGSPKPQKTASGGLSLSFYLPSGSLPLVSSGGDRWLYAVFTDDEGDVYSFSAEQRASAEAKPNSLGFALALPLGRTEAFGVSLDFSLLSFDNPILTSNEADPKGAGYLLNIAGGVNFTLPLGEHLEVSCGLGLGKYLLNTPNTLEKAGFWDEGFAAGSRVYPPGTTINLSGWSQLAGTAIFGFRFRFTPNLSLAGQYSYLPGGRITQFKYSLGGPFAHEIKAAEKPHPVNIQGQSALSLGVSVNF